MSFLLQQALKLHQSGALDQAKPLYIKLINAEPHNFNALQLLGSLYASQGQLDEAIELLSKADQVKPNQPQILVNLAICYKRNNDLKQALEVARKVTQYQPENQQAHLLIIRTLIEQCRCTEALNCCDDALTQVASSLPLLSKRAYILGQMERFDEAISEYQSLINEHPTNLELIHDMALVYRMQGKSELALEQYQFLQSREVRSYTLSHNMANAYSDVGQLNEAITLYRDALSQKPDYVEAHVNLNELLWELGDTDAFLKSYLHAIPLHPYNMALKYAYANALLRISNYKICADFLKAVPDSLRTSARYYDCLARAEKGLGNLKDCLALYQKAMLQADINKEQQLNYAQSLIEANQMADAIKLLDDLVIEYPQDQFAWALLGTAWRLAKSVQEGQLNDYENLVKVYDIDIPDGYASIEQFCAELNQYLDTLHTSEKQPLEQTLTGGTQTRGNLFNNSNQLISQLKTQIEKCVADYIEHTQQHEYLFECNSNEAFEFSGSWSVKLKSQGFHTPHVHPMGWISSAFYVDLPKTISEQDQQGWFCLGTPNLKTTPMLAAQKTIQPKVGRLVLFRSYMWHSTKPFKSDSPRTTVAFDVKMRRSPQIKSK